MTYLLTNASAMTALQSLQMTQQSLATTQSQLSTGLAIQNASDNSSYWSIATTMSSDNGALGAVQSSLAVSSSMLTNFQSAILQAISVVNIIKNDLTNASSAGANLTNIQSDITAQQNNLLTIAGGAAFNGQNWLNGTVNGVTSGAVTGSSTVQLAGSYTNSGGVGFISLQVSNVNLFTNGVAATSATSASGGILAVAQTASVASGITACGAVLGSGAFSVTTSSVGTQIAAMLAAANLTIAALETAGANVGAAQSQVTTQQTFVATMQTNLSNGVASLIDADMNQVSTRLQALQTQQQLGVQSLSIANQSTSSIMKLFQ
jgi:flagellin